MSSAQDTIGAMRTRALQIAAILVTVVVALTVLGCGRDPVAGEDFPLFATEPAAPDLSSPESAVRSYLDWISYAYRLADSSVASNTMTPWEGVRIDSYVQLNVQEGRALEQSLVSFKTRSVSIEGTSAVVVAGEDWEYRYINISTGYYDGELRQASYDATYTVARYPEGWLVDKVEATPLTPLE